MNWRIAIYSLGVSVCGGLVALAQPGSVTVQLPTFHSFTVNTTVSVPTGGGITLGGISRSFQRSSRRGLPALGRLPFANPPLGAREAGWARTASATNVRVTTIDLNQLDPYRRQLPLPTMRSLPGSMWTGGTGQARDQEAIARRVAEIRRLQLRE